MIQLSFVTGQIDGSRGLAHQIWASADLSSPTREFECAILHSILKYLENYREMFDSRRAYPKPHSYFAPEGNSDTFTEYKDGRMHVGLHAHEHFDATGRRGPTTLRHHHFQNIGEHVLWHHPDLVTVTPESMRIPSLPRRRAAGKYSKNLQTVVQL